MNIHITVNGKVRTISEGMSILSLLKLFEVEPSRVAVEHNKNIIDRNQFDSPILKEGDCLEIITFVGGGHG